MTTHMFHPVTRDAETPHKAIPVDQAAFDAAGAQIEALYFAPYVIGPDMGLELRFSRKVAVVGCLRHLLETIILDMTAHGEGLTYTWPEFLTLVQNLADEHEVPMSEQVLGMDDELGDPHGTLPVLASQARTYVRERLSHVSRFADHLYKAHMAEVAARE